MLRLNMSWRRVLPSGLCALILLAAGCESFNWNYQPAAADSSLSIDPARIGAPGYSAMGHTGRGWSDPADEAVVAAYPNGAWRPTGMLASVPVVANCDATRGDIAIATPQGIFYCPVVAARSNAIWPGVGHFYFVHEFGHIALSTSDERAADRFAAQQLALVPGGDAFLRQAMRHFLQRGVEFHPRYGTMRSRAENISASSGIPLPVR